MKMINKITTAQACTVSTRSPELKNCHNGFTTSLWLAFLALFLLFFLPQAKAALWGNVLSEKAGFGYSILSKAGQSDSVSVGGDTELIAEDDSSDEEGEEPVPEIWLRNPELRSMDGVLYLWFRVEGTESFIIQRSTDGVEWYQVVYTSAGDGYFRVKANLTKAFYRAEAKTPSTAFDLDIINPEQNSDIVWIGHINPDCDSLSSAVACAVLYGGTPMLSGNVGGEARLLFDLAGYALPEVAGDLSETRIGLVDHNQRSQMVSTINAKKVVCIIDHHAWQEDTVLLPLYASADVRPWVAAAAIVADRYLKSGRPMEQGIAMLLLGGMLSDSSNVTSSSLSPRQYEIMEELAEIAQVEDIYVLGRALLEARSDYSNMTATEVLTSDFKDYSINGNKVGFGVAETLYSEELRVRIAELEVAAKELRAAGEYDYYFFTIRDLKADISYLLCVEEVDAALAQQAFGDYYIGTEGNWTIMNLTGRKKRLIPAIESVLEESED